MIGYEVFEQPVSEEIFNDLKDSAIKIWQTYDDQYGYATEKIDRVNGITNNFGNWWGIIGMFDPWNQQKLLKQVKLSETRLFLNDILYGLSNGDY